MAEDYGDWSDKELHDELSDLDIDIQYWQRVLVGARKRIDTSMDSKEKVLEIIKQRGKSRS